MNEKLIVTLWRGQIRKPTERLYGVYCRLKFGREERRSKTVHDTKLLPWKQTFVFPLVHAHQQYLRLEFINLQEGEQIHFSGDKIAQTICFASAVVTVPIEQTSTKGTIPKKVDIVNEMGQPIGKVFLEYELLRSEVKYMVEKQIQYKYMLSLSQIKVSFVRNLKDEPVFFIQATIGDEVKREEFPMACVNGDYYYNYPIKYYLKNQQNIKFQLITKSGQTHAIAPPHLLQRTPSPKKGGVGSIAQSSETQSIGKAIKRKMSVEALELYSIFDLIYTKNTQVQEKIPLYIPPQRQVGFLQFNAEVIFKSKDELKQQAKQQQKVNPKKSVASSPQKMSIVARNGSIIVNSIIARLEPFNEQVIKNKNFCIELKIGKQKIESSTLQHPGKQIIFIDNFKFKRTWQQKLLFSIIVKDPEAGSQNPMFFSEVNLRQLFDSGRFIAKHLILVDDAHNYSGQIIVDVAYVEEEKKKEVKQESPPKTEEEIKEQMKRLKLERIKERMMVRQQEREARSLENSSNNHSLVLPPISERNYEDAGGERSPRRRRRGVAGSHNNSGHWSPPSEDISMRKLGLGDPKRNIFNKGQFIKFSKAARFQDDGPRYGDSFVSKPRSDFQKRGKGTSIGYGHKVDFTQNITGLPGVGRYQIPSLWDKYT